MKAVTKARFAAMLALVLLASPAWAQVYNPATPGVPPPILPPTPPQAQPGMAPIPPVIGESSRTSQTRLPGGMSPGRAARETINDRAVRCAHQGAALGVPAGAQGQYTRECVNN
jgi:hypothetical protein